MDSKWIEARRAECLAKAQIKRAEIVGEIDNAKFLTKEDKETLKSVLDAECGQYCNAFESSAIIALCDNHDKDEEDTMRFFDIWDFVHSLKTDTYSWLLYQSTSNWLNRYLDSEQMEFDGDVIITDPCYIMRAEHHGTVPITEDDWDACECGSKMEALGINQYITRDTIYGDWGCTVYDTDTKQPMGEFCADAGLVSVFLLDEVLKYNPDFDYHKERGWTTTLIPDFKGTVQIVVERSEGVYEEDSEYRKAGDKWEDFSVHVVGHGVNKKTGKPINFRSTQSSL